MVAGSNPAGRAIKAKLVSEASYMYDVHRNMVGVAQLVEHGIVIPGVVGSKPIVHPIFGKLSACKALSVSYKADVVELVDTPDLGSGAARCESSSLSVRTI